MDSLRGLAITLMVFSHARQLLSGRVVYETPTGVVPAPLEGLAWFIRALAHLSAPAFFLLLGMAVVLAAPKSIARVFRRGTVLILLQVSLVNAAWILPELLRGDPGDGTKLYLGVLFSLGVAAMVTGLAREMPTTVLLVASFACVGVAVLPGASNVGIWSWLATGIHEGWLRLPYPILPWLGVSLLGLVIARTRHLLQRYTRVASFLVAAVAAGVLTGRLPFHKYPPSASLLLGITAILIGLLWLFESFKPLNFRWLQVVGRHALLLYVVHLYILGLITSWWQSQWAGAALPLGLAVVIACVFIARTFEASPLSGGQRNAFNTYHDVYDRFMSLCGLYETKEVGRSLPAGGRRLLDLGGGTGHIAERLRRDFDFVLVVDTSAPMLSVAQRRGVPVCQASACRVPLPDNSVDAIICTDALHHIKDVSGVTAEMARLLEPGGRVVIQDFHTRGVRGRILFALERLFVDRSEFVSPAILQDTMTRSGFRGCIRPISAVGYIYEGVLETEEGP